MKSEEKLSRLFESLKAEKATTSINDITSWIQSPGAVHTNVGKNGLMTRVILIGIITTSIIGMSTMLFHKTNTSNTPTNLIKSDVPKVLDTITPAFKPVPLLPIKKTPLSLTPIILVEDESQMELLDIPQQFPPVILKDLNVAEQNDSLIIDSLHVRKWTSSNQGLQIDTLIQDIHTLIFKVDNCDIAIEGGSQSDVSIQYIDQIGKKLDQKTANEGYCQMNYHLQDSVLTINCEMQSPYKKNLLKFIVPERLNLQINTAFANIQASGLNNVNLKLNTAFGDIDIENTSGILNISTQFGNINLKKLDGEIKSHTTFGDIKGIDLYLTGQNELTAEEGNISVENASGFIKMNTQFGDITLNNIDGQTYSNSAFGDIKGVNINANGTSSFSSEQGNVQIQLNNPLEDCTLDLTSSIGIIRINRPELKKKGSGRINFGDGKIKVIMRSEMGKVVLH
ncbi:MAG: putative adhesin [Bacteroidota bacterium]